MKWLKLFDMHMEAWLLNPTRKESTSNLYACDLSPIHYSPSSYEASLAFKTLFFIYQDCFQILQLVFYSLMCEILEGIYFFGLHLILLLQLVYFVRLDNVFYPLLCCPFPLLDSFLHLVIYHILH